MTALLCAHSYHNECIQACCTARGTTIDQLPCPQCKRVSGLTVDEEGSVSDDGASSPELLFGLPASGSGDAPASGSGEAPASGSGEAQVNHSSAAPIPMQPSSPPLLQPPPPGDFAASEPANAIEGLLEGVQPKAKAKSSAKRKAKAKAKSAPVGEPKAVVVPKEGAEQNDGAVVVPKPKATAKSKSKSKAAQPAVGLSKASPPPKAAKSKAAAVTGAANLDETGPPAKAAKSTALVPVKAPPVVVVQPSPLFQGLALCDTCGNYRQFDRVRVSNKSAEAFRCFSCHSKQCTLRRAFGRWPSEQFWARDS